MFIRKTLCLLFVLALSLLTACQVGLEPTSLPAADKQYWTEMQQKLAQINALKIQGRIGYISRKERGSASFDFEAEEQEFELALYTTLAVQVAKLTQLKDHAELIINNEQKSASTADELLAEGLGLSLPTSDLKHLFLGLPPGQRNFSANGKITGAVFENYQISYQEFKVFNGYALPVEFSIKNGDNLIKVKVHKVVELH